MPTPVPSASWHAKTYGGYDRTSTEAFENAICVYNLLSSLGWTIAAMCAVYGNIEAESGYNPWRWEGDNVPYYGSSPSYGYGFPQFTPSRKYIMDANAQANEGYGPNYADYTGNVYDGDSQLRFIDVYADYGINPGYNYPITYEQFKTDTTLSPEYLAKAWLHNYERPRDQSVSVENYRASIARYWYDLLIEYDPSEPIPPEPGPGPGPTPTYQQIASERTFKVNFYLKPWWKRL